MNFNYLTPRWFTLPQKALEHPTQAQFLNDFKSKKFYHFVIAAGRRSYKTERFAKRLAVRECLNNPNHNYHLGAPVRKQAKEIFWKDVKALSPKHLVKRINESELKIEYINGTTLNVVGLLEFSTIEGGYSHGFFISEYQKCSPEVYSQSIEPMINDVGGFVIKEGRPLEKNHFYLDYLAGLEKRPGHASYHWTSEDILNDLQIQRAKQSLGEIDYKREYLASFETAGSSPYYAFDPFLNSSEYNINPGLPVILTCDFNATEKPMSWVIGQRRYEHNADVTHWTKCFSYQYTNTAAMCEVVDEYFKTLPGYPVQVLAYGDYAGKKETSNSSFSDWEILQKYFSGRTKFETRIKPCKSIRDSIAATNSQLCNSLNQRRQFVNTEQCTALVKDWELCKWKDNGRELDEKDPLRGHACRAVDYYNDYEHSIKSVNVKSFKGFDN